MANHQLQEPGDKRLHIPDTSGMRTHCNKHTFHKPTKYRVDAFVDEVDGIKVCTTCLNKASGIEKRARKQAQREQV
jgi:hypothetical protein